LDEQRLRAYVVELDPRVYGRIISSFCSLATSTM
jgi:hypothetical protein